MNTKYWIIKAFFNDRGTNVIKEWLEKYDIPTDAKVRIETRFRYLETQRNWACRPYSQKLRGKYKDIWEVIIKFNKVQYRPLGFWGPNRGEFTLLAGAIEKDSEFVPKAAPQTADARRKIILEDNNYAIEYFKKL